jgi:hypothetical protein
MPHATEHIAFRLSNGTRGNAVVLRIPLPDGRTLIACRNDDEEDDAPVNMAVEQLFREVCERHRLDPAKLVWVEYTSDTLTTGAGTVGGWEVVTWQGGPGRSPTWRQMTAKDWAELGTVPPPGPPRRA